MLFVLSRMGFGDGMGGGKELIEIHVEAIFNDSL